MENEPDGGLLTPQQRAKLRNGFEDQTQSAKRMTQLRMQRRAARMLNYDAEFLIDHVDPVQTAGDLTDGDAAAGGRALVTWLYRVLDAAGADPEKIIEDGMSQARGDRLDRIVEKLNGNPGEVTMDELEMLRQHGILDNADYSELFKQWLGSGGELDGESVLDAVNRTD